MAPLLLGFGFDVAILCAAQRTTKRQGQIHKQNGRLGCTGLAAHRSRIRMRAVVAQKIPLPMPAHKAAVPVCTTAPRRENVTQREQSSARVEFTSENLSGVPRLLGQVSDEEVGGDFVLGDDGAAVLRRQKHTSA